jgi:hypothetical protein
VAYQDLERIERPRWLAAKTPSNCIGHRTIRNRWTNDEHQGDRRNYHQVGERAGRPEHDGRQQHQIEWTKDKRRNGDEGAKTPAE